MGFISEFRHIRSQPPVTQAPAPQEQAPPAVKKQRGFVADFGKAQPDPPADVYQAQPQEVAPQPTAEEKPPARRGWSSSPSPTPEPKRYSYDSGPLLMTGGSTDSAAPAYSKRDIDAVGSEIRSLTSRLSELGRSGSRSKVSDLEAELSSAKSSLSGAKEAVSEKRERLRRLEHYLERTKRIVSKMEMRQSGFDSGHTRGYGGGGRRWRNNDEFLYSRGELRGPEYADERKAQMALVLDSKRDKVWELQDKVSSTRSALHSAESRVRELEQKISSKTDELYRARVAKQNAAEEKSSLESKVSELKKRYERMTGKSYSGGLFF